MAGSSNIQWCEPCGRDGENQQAHSWCSDCSEPLCRDCLQFHRKGKTIANHQIIPILEAEKLSASVLNIPETCHIHDGQKLSLFCKQHDQLCCVFCLRESHKACKGVEAIEKASTAVKMGTAVKDLQRRISELSLQIDKILNVYKINWSSMSNQTDKFKEKFRIIRKDLNTYLDELEPVMNKNLDDCDKECKVELVENIKDLTDRKKNLESRQTAIETLTQHASETRIFATVKTLDHLQVEEEVFLSKFQEDFGAYAVRSPSFDIIKKIQPILTTLSDIKTEKIRITIQHSLNPQQVSAYKFQQGKSKLLQQISSSKLEMKAFRSACLTMDNSIVFVGYPLRVSVRILLRKNYLPITPANFYNRKNGSNCRDDALPIKLLKTDTL